MLWSFGQPIDGVVQTAYVVPRLAEAIDLWIAHLRVGPWFVLDRLEAAGATARRSGPAAK